MLNKKGMELAIGTVTIIAIVLVVLLVVSSFFLGGFGRAGGGIASYISSVEEQADYDVTLPSFGGS